MMNMRRYRNTDRPDEEGIKTQVLGDALLKGGNTDRPDEEGIKTIRYVKFLRGTAKHRQT